MIQLEYLNMLQLIVTIVAVPVIIGAVLALRDS